MGNETESVAKFCTHTLCTSTLTVMPQLTSKPDIPITYFATCVFHTRLSKYLQYIHSFTKCQHGNLLPMKRTLANNDYIKYFQSTSIYIHSQITDMAIFFLCEERLQTLLKYIKLQVRLHGMNVSKNVL